MEKHAMEVAEHRRCPFGVPEITDTKNTAFYCRVPAGRVHIPTAVEEALYCRAGRFYACPIVRRYVRDN